MDFTTVKVAGRKAVALLDEYRSHYRKTGQYPFLIGDAKELEAIEELAKFNEASPAETIQASLEIDITAWLNERRGDNERYEFDEEPEGEWPGEVADKGAIGLHKDVVSGKIKPEVYLGLATIEEPWHLPAILKYGAWNECPEPEVHCALHRHWQEQYGAEITGMSSDVIECKVTNPPEDREAAMALAWEQYWYCADIVDQGCDSVAHLAATLLNSPYWYFWWD